MAVELLHYRPWRGTLSASAWAVWPIARSSLGMMFRRKMFWGLYALGLAFFLMFFFGQYLLSFVQAQPQASGVISWARKNLVWMSGEAAYYQGFLRLQSSMVMVVLALTGSVLVGNDFHFNSLTFYLSKPISPWHYLLGKALAVSVFVNLMTTIPALILFVQFGLLAEDSYFLPHLHIGVGLLGYGLVLTVCLSLFLLTVAVAMRRTIPLIMAWTTIFLFTRLLTMTLVRTLQYSPRWRLFDLYNDMSLVGGACLGLVPEQNHPEPFEAALVLCGVSVACVAYLHRRIQAVEIVA